MLITLADESRRMQSSISKVGVSTKPARSLEKSVQDTAITALTGIHMPGGELSRLGRWAIVLIQFSGISLLTKFEKGLHLLLHEFSAALFAQVDLILVDDHDPHTFPLFPAGFADLGFDLGFKPPHEERVCNCFSGLSARDALDLCHGVSILPNKL
jgi:hypothetical protein